MPRSALSLDHNSSVTAASTNWCFLMVAKLIGLLLV